MVEYKAFASQKENTNYNHIYMKKKKTNANCCISVPLGSMEL